MIKDLTGLDFSEYHHTLHDQLDQQGIWEPMREAIRQAEIRNKLERRALVLSYQGVWLWD